MEAFLVILKRTPIWTVIGPFQKGDLLTGNLSRKGLPIEGGFQVGGAVGSRLRSCTFRELGQPRSQESAFSIRGAQQAGCPYSKGTAKSRPGNSPRGEGRSEKLCRG